MRGCLGFLVFAAILVTLVAAAAVQLVLPAVVTAAVRSSPLLAGQPVEVHVDTSLAGVLLDGRIDSIRITGSHLSEQSATIDALDLELLDVSIEKHTFATATGSLTGLTIATSAGAIPLGEVQLSGGSPAVTATLTLGGAEAVAFLEDRARASGAPAGTTVALTQGGVDVVIAGTRVPARIEVTPEAIRLVVDALGLHATLLESPANGAWRIADLVVSPEGLSLTLDVGVD